MNRKSTTLPAHVSFDTIAKESGKTLKQWFNLLDSCLDEFKSVQECANFISKEYGVLPEWALAITKARFLNSEKGELELQINYFDTSATRTFPLGIHVIEAFFIHDDLRKSWLEDQFVPINVNTGRSLRLSGVEEGNFK
ncbi:MAG: hypothetical protein WED33_07750 [Bacteroidia bacterium]